MGHNKWMIACLGCLVASAIPGELVEVDSNGTACGHEGILVVKGDTNCTGTATQTDSTDIINFRLQERKVTDEYTLAADVDGNGEIELNDVRMILKCALGIILL